ncbi:MAG: hypothetical protein ACR5LG_04845 [Sodalis sp. (in: enterobacteria)]|uniref:hypothetical protein n=1 Tax=Sodalis sp. (in: enterobacteria) TaxID=1898979 RepID=UPI003F2E4BA6
MCPVKRWRPDWTVLWQLSYRQGRFYAWRDGVEQEVRYDIKTARWEAADAQSLPVAQERDRAYHIQQRIIRQLALRVKSVRLVAREAQGGQASMTSRWPTVRAGKSASR